MPATARRFPWEFAALAVLSVLASLALGVFVISLHRDDAEQVFHERAEAIHEAIVQRIASAEAVVTALAGLHHASDDLQPHEFSALAQELLKTYPFIQSIGEATWVPAQERAAFEAEVRAQGLPQFAITQRGPDAGLAIAGPRDAYLPLQTLEPLDPILARLLGFDFLSEPGLAKVAEQAIASGNVAISPVYDFPHGGRGFVMVQAIYLGYTAPPTADQRRAQLRGLVVLHQTSDALLADALGETTDLEVGFGDPNDAALLFRLTVDKADSLLDMGQFVFRRPIVLRERSFGLELAKRPGIGFIPVDLVILVMLLPAIAGGGIATALKSRYRALREIEESARKVLSNEQRLRDYAEVSSDWFWETDGALRFNYLSCPVSAITGLAPGDALATIVERAGDERPVCECGDFAGCLDQRDRFRDVRFRFESEDGDVRWWALSGKPVLDEAGAFLCYRGTGREITTEITNAEILVAAKEAAELANRSKSQFLASISHELRTPLNAIIGFSELMEREVLGPLGRSEYRDYVGDIGDSGRHLLDLINDILDISKIESGATTIVEDILEIRQVITSSIAMVKGRAREGGVELTVEMPDDLPLLRADPRKLKQVLVNLLANSVKFTPAGGQVTTGTRRQPDGALRIWVADTGIGMAPEDIPKALTAFQQIDSDLNRKFEGTGLGLPLAKAMIELHDGSLSIESAVGHGTVVTIVLPAGRLCDDDQSPAPALKAG